MPVLKPPAWHPDSLLSLIPIENESGHTANNHLASELSLYRQHYHLPNPEQTDDWRDHQITYASVAGYQITVQRWLHARPVGNLILVHGYYDHVGLYGSVVRFCQQQGWNLFAFDLPGHGLSSGQRAVIHHFREYVDVFNQLYTLATQHWSGDWYALGQSTGGGILANWLLQHRPIAGESGPLSVALLAPLLKPSGWHLGKALTPLAGLFTQQLRRRFRHDGNTPTFSRFLEQDDPLQSRYLSVKWVNALRQWIPEMEHQPSLDYPVLLIQGEQDKTVDWRYNLPVYQRLFPALETLRMPAAHHHLVNDISSHQCEMYQWIARHFMVSSTQH